MREVVRGWHPAWRRATCVILPASIGSRRSAGYSDGGVVQDGDVRPSQPLGRDKRSQKQLGIGNLQGAEDREMKDVEHGQQKDGRNIRLTCICNASCGESATE